MEESSTSQSFGAAHHGEQSESNNAAASKKASTPNPEKVKAMRATPVTKSGVGGLPGMKRPGMDPRANQKAKAAQVRMRMNISNHIGSLSLAKACSEGDVDAVKQLLAEGRSIHELSEEGECLLTVACKAGHIEVVRVLLAKDANIDDPGAKFDCTPLMEAAKLGHTDIIKLLLDYKASVNRQNSSGVSALMYACSNGHEQVVELLLKHGADIEAQNAAGDTPLIIAASNGQVGVARILLKHRADINKVSKERNESALTRACLSGHLDVVKFLLEAGANREHMTEENNTALMEACVGGNIEVVRFLLDSGSQVNKPEKSLTTPLRWEYMPEKKNLTTPLTLAAKMGHIVVVKLLIERGANIDEENHDGCTALMEASEHGNEEMVEFLMSKGADIHKMTKSQETALTRACRGGHLKVANILLKAGADVESGGWTPLMWAARAGHLDLTQLLIRKYKANVHAQTQDNNTALIMACGMGRTAVASFLLRSGADLEHGNMRERTALMLACQGGNTATVEYLISVNADVNKKSSIDDATPLSLAVSQGQEDIVGLLLANGADMFHRIQDDSTMLIEAAKYGYTDIVRLLLDHLDSLKMDPASEPKPPLQPVTSSYIEAETTTAHYTALLSACAEGHEEVVELLLSRGADIEHCDKKGRSPLRRALNAKDEKLVELLLNHGAEIESYDEDRMSCLMIAVHYGLVNSVNMMMKREKQRREEGKKVYKYLAEEILLLFYCNEVTRYGFNEERLECVKLIRDSEYLLPFDEVVRRLMDDIMVGERKEERRFGE